MYGGRTLTYGTKYNYALLLDRLVEFEKITGFDLHVKPLNNNNKRVFNQQKNIIKNSIKPLLIIYINIADSLTIQLELMLNI
jgi:hypothetical protein